MQNQIKYRTNLNVLAEAGLNSYLRDAEIAMYHSIDVELDDFGTGHSSMTYLQRLPVTGLKIDQSFVKNIDDGDGRSESILVATINLAKAMELKLTAEGVETESQFRAKNCTELAFKKLITPILYRGAFRICTSP